MTSLKEFTDTLAAAIRGDRPAPPADEFDDGKYPFGVEAGNNKFGAQTCPTCGKPPTKVGRQGFPPECFLFVDALSAGEYQISAMCQACQDATFKDDEGSEGEESVEEGVFINPQPTLQAAWDKAYAEPGSEVSIGDIVVCDFCNEDYTTRPDSGGFVFSGSGVCPECAPGHMKLVEKYNEHHFIKARCPEGKSFGDFIREFRGPNNTIRVTHGKPDIQF